jgi:hypothetical protein
MTREEGEGGEGWRVLIFDFLFFTFFSLSPLRGRRTWEVIIFLIASNRINEHT